MPRGVGGCAYARYGRIRVPGSSVKERSRSAHHSDDGRLHTGFGARSDSPGSVGLAHYDQRRRWRVLEEQLLKDLEFHGIVGKSPAMLEVFDFARKVARHYPNVLLVGTTGNGQDVV